MKIYFKIYSPVAGYFVSLLEKKHKYKTKTKSFIPSCGFPYATGV